MDGLEARVGLQELRPQLGHDLGEAGIAEGAFDRLTADVPRVEVEL